MRDSFATCLLVFAFAVVVVAFALASTAVAKKSTKDWDSMDWKALEKDWESGDESPELTYDGEERFEKIQEKSEKIRELPLNEAQKLYANSGGVHQVGTDGIDPRMIASQHQAATHGRPSMMFVSINTVKDDGTPWTKADTQDVAGRWKELLSTGGLDANCYAIELKQLLVTVLNGGNSIELMNTFILQQPETLQVQWDQQTYYPTGRIPSGSRMRQKGRKEKRRSKRIEKGKKQEKKSKEKISKAPRDEEL